MVGSNGTHEVNGHTVNGTSRLISPAEAVPSELPPPLGPVSDGGAPPPPAAIATPPMLAPVETSADRRQPADLSATAGGDRDSGSGRFTPGNKAGRGNPFSRKLGAMRSAFLDAVSADQVRALAQKLMGMALDGDLAAAQMVLL